VYKRQVESQGSVVPPEKDVVEAMQVFVSAGQEIIEATNNAISTALEAKQKQ